MKKYFSPEVENKLNDLLGVFFKANSIADNVAYALDCELECPNASKIYHLNFAHAFPGDSFADGLSDFMIENNMRPVRRGMVGDEKSYENIVVAFEDTVAMVEDLKNKVEGLIEEFDYDVANKAVVIHLEEVLITIVHYLKIANKWLDKANAYYKAGAAYKFDVDFEDFVEF